MSGRGYIYYYRDMKEDQGCAFSVSLENKQYGMLRI